MEAETKTPALSSMTHAFSVGSFLMSQPGGGGGAPPSSTGIAGPASSGLENGLAAHAQKTNEDKAVAMDLRMGKYLHTPIGTARWKLR
jgi:hypothetical protein